MIIKHKIRMRRCRDQDSDRPHRRGYYLPGSFGGMNKQYGLIVVQ
ncbi:MAG TPA: hypothetical protein VIH42_05145 [Thermoguttaceae bacterium]